MDLLEHPLEAVAFRLYSLQIPEAPSAATGAAAWTCLAAVLAAAAAAGLWRLRSSTPAVVSAGTTKPLEPEAPSRAAEVSPAKPCIKPSSQRSPEPAAAPSPSPSPKERYTAYYRDAGCRVGCCDVGGDEDGAEEEDDGDDAGEHEDSDRDVFGSDGADPFGWAEVVRSLPLSPTAAEMGRRRYRPRSPTAALGGGSVVQLWGQGGLTPTASPRRRGRVVVGAAVSAL